MEQLKGRQSRPVGNDLKLFWLLALACSTAALFFGLNEGRNLLQMRQELGYLPEGWQMMALTELILVYLSSYAWALLLVLHRPAARVIGRRLKPVWARTTDVPLAAVRERLQQLASDMGYRYDQLPDGTQVLATRPNLRDPGYFIPVYLTAEGDQTRIELEIWARSHPLLLLLDPRRWLFLARPEGPPGFNISQTQGQIMKQIETILQSKTDQA